MNVKLSLVVLTALLAVPVSETRAEDGLADFEKTRVELSADEKPQYVLARLHASAKLKNVSFRFDDEPWQPTVADLEQHVTYTMKHPRAVIAGRRITAKAQSPTTQHWIVISGKINAQENFEELDRKIVDNVEAAKVGSLADVASRDATGLDGYPGDFLSIVNDYRARMGRGALTYAHSLEAIAARNNQAGGYHNYTGGTAQVWAMGSSSAAGTVRQWQNSPPHNVILLGGYSRVGISHDGRNWTANFR